MPSSRLGSTQYSCQFRMRPANLSLSIAVLLPRCLSLQSAASLSFGSSVRGEWLLCFFSGSGKTSPEPSCEKYAFDS